MNSFVLCALIYLLIQHAVILTFSDSNSNSDLSNAGIGDIKSSANSRKRCPDKEESLRSKKNINSAGESAEIADRAKDAGHLKAKLPHRFCNGLNPCGHWKNRFWHPRGCYYQDVSPSDARKCLGNRTIAFVGDSQIRDISFGVALLLAGADLGTAPEEKFDKHRDNINLTSISTRIENFAHWKSNVPAHNYNGHIFPEKKLGIEQGWQYQIQVWNLFRNEFIHGGQVEDILNDNTKNHNPLLRPIDLAFWSHGLHDWGWWDKQPYGEKYFETMVSQWTTKRQSLKVDSVWVSMNNECYEKLKYPFKDMKTQFEMVEAANDYVNARLSDEGLPYWDAAAPLRSPERCQIMADGMHVNMYVDIMRAKMLFNHLCDHNMNWIGSSKRFL